jgi:hypothetical protein
MRRPLVTLDDREDRAKSRDMCGIYLRHYGGTVHASMRADADRFAVGLARMWNGGPTGHLKESTRRYAARFAGVWARRKAVAK